jgi:hypothetical protein
MVRRLGLFTGVGMMAISAEISRTEIEGSNLILWLQSTPEYGGHMSIVGQEKLIVRNYTRLPNPGQVIWGGADTIHIEPGMGNDETWHYRRTSTTELKESER